MLGKCNINDVIGEDRQVRLAAFEEMKGISEERRAKFESKSPPSGARYKMDVSQIASCIQTKRNIAVVIYNRVDHYETLLLPPPRRPPFMRFWETVEISVSLLRYVFICVCNYCVLRCAETMEGADDLSLIHISEPTRPY